MIRSSLTSRDISVNLNIVSVAVERVDLNIEVGGNERATDVICWRDWRQKGHDKADFVVDGLVEDRFGRGVLEGGLIDLCNGCTRAKCRSTHPDIRNAVDPDQTSPTSDLSSDTCQCRP